MDYYRIQLLGHTFVAQVSQPDGEDLNCHLIYIGGKSKKCCRFLVDRGQHSIVLEDFYYNENCRAFQGLTRGYGTKVLLYASLLFLRHMYPECKTLTLQDESKREVESLDGKHGLIPLADWNLLVHGKTWYQRAIPGLTLSPTSKYKKCVSTILKNLQSTRFKSSMNFESFINSVVPKKTSVYILHIKNDSELIAGLRDIYVNGKTMQGFFSGLDQWTKGQLKAFKSVPPKKVDAFILELIPQFMNHLIGFHKFPGSMSLQGSVWEASLEDVESQLTKKMKASLVINQTEEYNGTEFKVKHRLFPGYNDGRGRGADYWTNRTNHVGNNTSNKV